MSYDASIEQLRQYLEARCHHLSGQESAAALAEGVASPLACRMLTEALSNAEVTTAEVALALGLGAAESSALHAAIQAGVAAWGVEGAVERLDDALRLGIETAASLAP